MRALLFVVLFGCETPPALPPGATDQVANGQHIYGAQCAECHGVKGDGTDKGPALVGKAALPLRPRPRAEMRKTDFRTAQDVYEFMHRHMPPNNPGGLSDSQYADVLAYALTMNGINLHGMHVDGVSAATIVLH
jgi:mono/diheme cytochrome c family protein